MRSIWNGSISFGLVTIPVKIYSASEDRKLDLDMLDKSDHARIRYKRVNENSGEEVEWKDIVKGYRQGDSYIILTDEDFESANVKKSRTIDIEEFIDESDVADVLFKKPYFLEPQKGGEKSYNLLKQALVETGKLGVATFVMRQKENLSLVGVYEEVMVLHVIRFSDEIRDPSKLKLPDTAVSEREVEMAKTLIDQYTEDFEFKKYKDVYNDQLLKIIEAKTAGTPPTSEKFESKPTPAKDLMAQLKASLEKRNKNKAS